MNSVLLLPHPVLAEADSRFTSIFFILFLAFGVAAIVWLILWMLSRSAESAESAESAGDSDARESSGDSTASSALAASPPTAEKETKPAGDPEIAEDFRAASEEEAAELFAEELESGKVKQDPVYGIIYTEAPDEADDLKKIKGVAKVLEGKLNGIGVYRFKQVAVWTEAACDEFSNLLTFKNRIYQDNWIAQAKEFHREKYGEEL